MSTFNNSMNSTKYVDGLEKLHKARWRNVTLQSKHDFTVYILNNDIDTLDIKTIQDNIFDYYQSKLS